MLRSLVEGAKSFDNTGRASAVVHVLMYGGLRISELRGLDRKFARLIAPNTTIEIVQRADRYNVIGSVKSVAGRRTVDIGPATAQAVRVWLMRHRKRPRRTARPTRKSAPNMYSRMKMAGCGLTRISAPASGCR